MTVEEFQAVDHALAKVTGDIAAQMKYYNENVALKVDIFREIFYELQDVYMNVINYRRDFINRFRSSLEKSR